MVSKIDEEQFYLLRAIAEYSSSFIGAKDLQGRYLYVNNQYSRFFSRPVESFINKTDAEIFPPDVAEKFRDADLQVINARKYMLVEEQICVEDEIHYYLSAKFPIFDKGNKLFATGVIATDITEQKMLEYRLKQLAETDSLTNCANRRKIFDIAEKEVAKALRYETPLSVMLLDIDHFKAVNDTLGHGSGDATLQQIAGICSDNIRKVDEIGRIGGDEFLIVLPNTALTHASNLAAKLVSCVEQSILTDSNEQDIKVTICAGVAELNDDNNSVATLINAADRALYSAKKTGRNKACVTAQ